MRATVATEFVAREVPNLENMQTGEVYGFRIKLNNGGKLSGEEKTRLTHAVNGNTYFKSAVPLQGWRFDFFDILRTYIVNQYGQWTEYKATDKTGLRRFLYGRIDSIVELKNR
ncbi:molybdenum ABC transporter ATP-binding protein [uncultured Coprobacter sp.]|uniref:molybdenum ABC transporter ATP-binding protein n=1 Tax=uncultured Coprobacter sp. TaxID=1720550 RepID=UPI00261AE9AD|nr:molybdenum ABC transporter ATP-binding protein [uncultured Coprobacter sp.]